MSVPGNDAPLAGQAQPDLPPDGELFFAYGTLKQGGQYHHLLKDMAAEFVGRGQLVIPYPLILAEYPCLLDQPGSGLGVKGEVFRIPQSADWKILDQLEDHPREYKRRRETIWLDRQRQTAWTYFYREPEKLDPGLLPVEEFPIL